jgi:3,4-dihydroxy 2-butanone 4-phosphate synthase/GTP cyclohydrolase II
VSIEAAEGVTTGISAADRARTVRRGRDATRPADLVQPGHVFPLQAQDGGVLMRAGHTEAGCDLAHGRADAGRGDLRDHERRRHHGRLPDLQRFAAEHGLKIGTIADLIGHRSRNESLVQKPGQPPAATAQGDFLCTVYRDRQGGSIWRWSHGRLGRGRRGAGARARALPCWTCSTAGPCGHSWPLQPRWPGDSQGPRGRAAQLRRHDGAPSSCSAVGSRRPGTPRGRMDLRTYGVGAQILRDLGVRACASWATRAACPA